MGKQYYCDYCDRSFADKGVNRKNHFKGSLHQRLRKQHYDSFKDAASTLTEDATKLPCKRFQMGSCDFGDSCRFSHMTPERRLQLEQQVTREKMAKDKREQEDFMEPSLDEWMAKRKKKLKNQEPESANTVESCDFQLPPLLMNIPNLPPSLLPPSTEELNNSPVCDWG